MCINSFLFLSAGFGQNSKDIDLNSVRLCFQVFLRGHKLIPLPVVVTEAIHDKKANAELVIFDISDVTSPPGGGKKIMIFVEKVAKEDIRVRFYEKDPTTDQVTWEGYGAFEPKNVHRQTAIALRTPKYRTNTFDSPVNVWMTLQRRSDDLESAPRPFQYVPDPNYRVNLKKRKIHESKELFHYLEKQQQPEHMNIMPTAAAAPATIPNSIQQNVKIEHKSRPEHFYQPQSVNSANGAVGYTSVATNNYQHPPVTATNQYYDQYYADGAVGGQSSYNIAAPYNTGAGNMSTM